MSTHNPWHSISVGENAPEVVHAIIEIPRGSKAKFEIDKSSNLVKLDRVLYSAVHYPQNYGLIPQTYCEDGDDLDVLVLCSEVLPPLCLVEVRVVGVMGMIDGGESDDKIIAVATKDPNMSHIHDLKDVPEHTLAEIKQFFEEYKKLEKKKTVEVTGFGDKAQAIQVVKDSMDLFKKTFTA
jgi:inorganic pyrophosphatase